MNHLKQITKKITTHLRSLGLSFLALCGLILVFSLTPIPGAIKLYTVTTSSMAPTISAGSIVIVKPQSDYQLNDIVTRFQPGKQNTITHRIIAIDQTGDSITFRTKGDANNTNDYQTIVAKNILGKVIFSIPLLGYFVSFAKSTPGLISLVIIPLTIVGILELKELYQLLIKMKKNKSRQSLFPSSR